MSVQLKKHKKTVLKKPLQRTEKKSNWFSQNSTILLILLIIVVTFITYSNSIKSNFVLLDDDVKIINNPFITKINFDIIAKFFTGFVFHTYMPLTTISYAIDYSLWALNPWGYHAENLLFHLINAVLVFIFIKNLTGRKNAAFIASMLFAVHPMNVESVSWISERSNLLFALFYIASLIFYIKFIDTSKKINLFIAFIFFMFSVFSKPSAVLLPFTLILIDYYKGLKINYKSLLQKTPFFIFSLLIGLLTIYATVETENIKDISLQFNFLDRIFLAFYPIAFYILKFFLPSNLNALHPYPDKTGGMLPWEFYVSAIVVILIVYYIWKRKSFKKEFIFGALFFLANISLFLMVLPAGGDFLMAEHFVYIPYIGFVFIAGMVFTRISDATLKAEKLKKMLPFLAVIILLVFAITSNKRNKVWKNSMNLFTDMVSKCPDKAFAHNGLALAKQFNKDYEGALKEFNITLELDSTRYEAFYNRALVKASLSFLEESIYDFNKTIKLSPEYYQAYADRANVKIRLGDSTGAMKDYNQCIKINPDFSSGYYNRGNLKLNLKEYSNALADFTRSIDLDNSYTDAYNNRGITRYYLKDYKGAIEDYSKVIILDSTYAMAYKNRGLAKLASFDTSAACEDFFKATSMGFKPAFGLHKKYCK